MQLLKRDYEPQAASITTEEWRTQIIAEKVAVLKWWEGAAAALYDLGGKAKVADIAEHRFIQAITAANGSNRNVRQTLWRTLQNHTVDESTTVKMKNASARPSSIKRLTRCGSSRVIGRMLAPT